MTTASCQGYSYMTKLIFFSKNLGVNVFESVRRMALVQSSGYAAHFAWENCKTESPPDVGQSQGSGRAQSVNNTDVHSYMKRVFLYFFSWINFYYLLILDSCFCKARAEPHPLNVKSCCIKSLFFSEGSVKWGQDCRQVQFPFRKLIDGASAFCNMLILVFTKYSLHSVITSNKSHIWNKEECSWVIYYIYLQSGSDPLVPFHFYCATNVLPVFILSLVVTFNKGHCDPEEA